VGCGLALTNEWVAIVAPDSRERLGADRVGEIWVSGPNVARAYWGNDEATITGLRAQIAGEDATSEWLRTGDLGFLNSEGEVFVTGRIKDLIIIRGNNHYPQDIEATVQAMHPALRQSGGAAFSVPDEHGGETLVIVQEVERTARNKIDPNEIAGLIREAVASEHELFARHILLIRPGTLPKTTSGKIQRGLTRTLWLARQLAELPA
jgi:acyl-CoA synthetase (AMP-forming)/AMP-acid ligase II